MRFERQLIHPFECSPKELGSTGASPLDRYAPRRPSAGAERLGWRKPRPIRVNGEGAVDCARGGRAPRNARIIAFYRLNNGICNLGCPMRINVGLITISDRAFRGEYSDLSGPALRQAAAGYGWNILAEATVPDDKNDIQRAVQIQAARDCHLILTTGGTGITSRDVTPEAVREIAVRDLPGFGEVMRAESLKITPHAILSRNLAVVVDRALLICLPGKPNAAVECLSFVSEAIPHAVELLQETPAH